MCPVSTFWTSANLGQSMLQSNTTGDVQVPDPTRIPGSSVGAVPSNYTTSARAVYPVYDGVTQVAGVRQSLAIDPRTGVIDYSRYPASFWANLDVNNPPANPAALTLASNPADFTNWHSAFQAEYISRVSTVTPPTYVVGTSLAAASAIYMLDDQNRPVNLLAMTLSDYAKLTDGEKTRFNANLVASGHLDRLGLSTSIAAKTAFLGTPGQLDPQSGPFTLEGRKALVNTSPMTSDQRALFTEQLQMLIDEVTASNAFSVEKIEAEANKIMARFNIVDLFVRTTPVPSAVSIYGRIEQSRLEVAGIRENFDYDEQATTTGLIRAPVNNLDEGATITKGIATFLRAETEILNMKQRREIITQNVAFRDPNLDVPNLIFQLQLLYEAEAEGVVDAGTEEFRQLHKLLEDYNVMQQLLGTTLAAFDAAKNDDKRRFMNIGGKSDGGVDGGQTQSTDLAFQDVDYRESFNGTTYVSIDVDAAPKYHWSLLANFSDPLRDIHSTYVSRLGVDGDTTGKLTRTEMLAFSMFADEAFASPSNRGHPIESLYGAERPKFDLVDSGDGGAGSLKLAGKNTFDQYQTALSNTITILNQQNQIKQNEVENATKQQNRHFELGNNALRKMNDLLLMIGRS